MGSIVQGLYRGFRALWLLTLQGRTSLNPTNSRVLELKKPALSSMRLLAFEMEGDPKPSTLVSPI